MLKSFFFIPGNHPKLLEKVDSIQADQIIIDLEDSINTNDLFRSLDVISQISQIHRLYFRPNLFENEIFNTSLFSNLVLMGIRKFIIPKFRSLKHLQSIEKLIDEDRKNEYSFILLIENPNSLFSLQSILTTTKLNIYGLGFGSHDYCSEVLMDHSLELLHYPRFSIVGLAKVFNLISIDIASMNIENEKDFLNDMNSASSYGYNAKFIIHPRQLELLEKYNNNSKVVDEAKEILKIYNKKGKPSIFIYKGRAIEPPHIKYYKELINKHDIDES